MSSPQVVPIEGEGNTSGGSTTRQPAPLPRTAPTYQPKAGGSGVYVAPGATNAAAQPAQGITVMNSDGSFFTTDINPYGGRRYPRYPGYEPQVQDSGMNDILQMLLLKQFLGKETREKAEREPPQVIVVQVPANSVSAAGLEPTLTDPSLTGSYSSKVTTKLRK